MRRSLSEALVVLEEVPFVGPEAKHCWTVGCSSARAFHHCAGSSYST